jgi:hypothetical protein
MSDQLCKDGKFTVFAKVISSDTKTITLKLKKTNGVIIGETVKVTFDQDHRKLFTHEMVTPFQEIPTPGVE